MAHDIVAANVSADARLGDYYMDLIPAVAPLSSGVYGPVDERGVPLIDYDRAFKSRWMLGRKRRTYGIHYTPVTVAQFALGLHAQLLKGEGSRETFLCQAGWLRDNLVAMPAGFGLWLHNFAQLSYRLEPPWVSGMAQGQGISTLLRAFQLTGDETYRDAAFFAAAAFAHDISEGGVACRDEDGSLWLEEYPSDPPSHVLNGFIFALWGVFDLWRVTEDARYRHLWDEGVQTLKRNLPRYERSGGWSRYDVLREEKVSSEYHWTHVVQLEIMGALTGENLFLEVAERWRRSGERSNETVISAVRVARGVLRRLGILPRPKVTGVSVRIPAKTLEPVRERLEMVVGKR